jgi:hypothetical protein
LVTLLVLVIPLLFFWFLPKEVSAKIKLVLSLATDFMVLLAYGLLKASEFLDLFKGLLST